MNMITQLKFEFTYYDVKVSYVSRFTTSILSHFLTDSLPIPRHWMLFTACNECIDNVGDNVGKKNLVL